MRNEGRTNARETSVAPRPREEPADREVDAARLGAPILVIAQVHLVHDLGELPEALVAEPAALDQGLEGAVLTLMPELRPEGVEQDRVRRELVRAGEDELG